MVTPPIDDGFGLSNLAYGSVMRPPDDSPRLCVRLGDQAVELGRLAADLDVAPDLVRAPNLDRLLAAGPPTWHRLRASLRERLADGPPPDASTPLREARLCLPFTVGDYVDFYSSIEHATNVGRLFRPDAPLTPNWRHVPIGYHGRRGTVVVTGTPVRRPLGQLPRDAAPEFAASERLDFELELAMVVGGSPNPLGEPIPIAEAAERIFGYVLVNDWSARDIQSWEYVPLGPFLGKSFMTSVSGWVVPSPALEPHRVPAREQDPAPLAYLRQPAPWALDIDLSVSVNGTVISRTNASGLYWTPLQQVPHCASNGAVLGPGDLLASGTISGGEPGSEGSLLELTHGGERSLTVAGEARTFLRDGDEVVLRGRAGEIALGEVRGRVLAAP